MLVGTGVAGGTSKTARLETPLQQLVDKNLAERTLACRGRWRGRPGATRLKVATDIDAMRRKLIATRSHRLHPDQCMRVVINSRRIASL